MLIKVLRLFRLFRGASLIAVSIYLLALSGLTFAQKTEAAVAEEHRFTTLEVEVGQLRSDMMEVKYLGMALLLGVAGLTGEAGLRVLKKKFDM